MMALLGPSFNLLLLLGGLLDLCKGGNCKLTAGERYPAVKRLIRKGGNFFVRSRSDAGEK